MSQYPPSNQPSPQQPSPYPMDFNYYPAAQDLLGPARRASVGMFVLAAFGLLCGVCVGTAPWVLPTDQLIAQFGVQLPASTEGISAEQLFRIALTFLGGSSFIIGIVLIAVGVFVRRGGKGAAVTGVVLCVILLLFCVLKVAAALLMSLQNPKGLLEALLTMIPTVLLVMVLIWLTQAIRAASQVSVQQQQMLAQMWQYQQQQAAYGGYHQGPANPPPAYGGYAPPPPYAAPPSNSPGAIGVPKPAESQSESLPPPNPPDAAP